MNRKPPPPCPECGEHFENVFDATDHLLEDDEEFDPALVLPNGYRLMIGSLLRCMYRYADKPDNIKGIAESTYMTLFTAETQPNVVAGMIEDMIVDTQMTDLDDELKNLLERGE
jgi:hypothetical protein